MYARISWHPSGRWLAVTDKTSAGRSRSLYLLSVPGGEKRRITSSSNTWADEDPSFSPDGRSIAFIREKTYASDVYLLRLDGDLAPKGEPVRLTFDDRPTMSPAWSADNRSIIYASGSDHNPRLWRIRPPQSDADRRPPELLAFAGYGTRTPTISHQGRLAFMAYQVDFDIQRIDLTGSPANPHAPNPAVTAIGSSRLDHTPQFHRMAVVLPLRPTVQAATRSGSATGTDRMRYR